MHQVFTRYACGENRTQSVILSRELDSFQSRLQPLLGIVSDLQTDSTMSRRVAVYLNDVKDHLQQVRKRGRSEPQLMNDIQYCSNRSNNVYNLVQTMRAKRQDRILLILTVITAIFTPISFLAGVYGMNFDYMPVRKRWRYSSRVYIGDTAILYSGCMCSSSSFRFPLY